MTNDVVPTSTTPLTVDKQILSAVKQRYDLNPKQKELVFEASALIAKLDNENDYLELITSLEGLKEKAGLDYAIDNTYTDSRGRTQHHTLYGSRLCKIKVIDKDLFEQALKNLQENTIEDVQKNSEIIEYSGLTYNLKSCELKYKNGKSTTVSPEKREMKFFLFLYRHKGEACSFKDIAKEVGTPEYLDNPELDNQDYTEEVSTLRRDLRKLLLSISMPAKKFDQMIERIPKLGYKLA